MWGPEDPPATLLSDSKHTLKWGQPYQKNWVCWKGCRRCVIDILRWDSRGICIIFNATYARFTFFKNHPTHKYPTWLGEWYDRSKNEQPSHGKHKVLTFTAMCMITRIIMEPHGIRPTTSFTCLFIKPSLGGELVTFTTRTGGGGWGGKLSIRHIQRRYNGSLDGAGLTISTGSFIRGAKWLVFGWKGTGKTFQVEGYGNMMGPFNIHGIVYGTPKRRAHVLDISLKALDIPWR